MLTPFDKQRRLQTRVHAMDEKGERPPKKFKVQKSASKLMATIFWDREGTRGSRTEATLSRRVLFLQDNASVHTARISRQALKDTGFSEIDHPPYSPDLAPSDYSLFSNLKKELRGRRFVDDNQMKMAVESHFDCKEKEYFLGGLKGHARVRITGKERKNYKTLKELSLSFKNLISSAQPVRLFVCGDPVHLPCKEVCLDRPLDCHNAPHLPLDPLPPPAPTTSTSAH
ncbi:Mariner Mos1 transposase [Eumeta japonica]|uniref:Mariner Mos1 transposase n=1 Tax=Eumeta variegata TaxID=151549 RepID=A0A4C2AA13_EUMVA|nr:Mariner Mos1 transposase [Eumeta japonica]